ncbi:protein mono-ADP-ribosyltransferase PARP14-like [Colossoma macropomum]|uniref:protein mono-ADP-ribosyltransferase PARP14-like n=1 Tax=Colossoma macropomum TaxID=42526 RepID=UPI0018648F57|nr:protein mono-ADP-ribosyltransferase PARP14-like [Colossoma macropomum]
MEDHPHPLTVEARWPSTSNKTLTAKLQIYFQSKKKSQGGDCVVRFPEESSAATVLFRSAETRDQVLAKRDHSISIENQLVKLKVFKPGDEERQTEEPSGAAETESDVAADVLQPVPTGQRTLSVRVDNIPADAVTDEDLLNLYFENCGGRVETIRTIPEEQAAIITFRSPDAVQRILDRTDHSLCRLPVSVQLYVEPDESQRDPPEECPKSSAVVLENVPQTFSREALVLLVENVSGLSEKEFSLESIRELKSAVVTFNDPNVSEKFLMESRSNTVFQQRCLLSRALEKSRSVKVENVPGEANKDLLQLYFERWGGQVEDIITSPEEQTAIVTFHSQEAMQNILGKEHCISDTAVNVYPYCMSLGTALYGKDRPTWMLPKPFTEKIHPAIREFLNNKGLISSICQEMDSLFCQVNMDKAEVQLSPLPTLLKQKGITKKHIDDWRQNATDGFKNIISKYAVFDHPVIPSVWSAVEKDIRSAVEDKAVMRLDDSVLTVAGVAEDINLLKPIVEDIFQRALNQLERDQNSVSDSIEMPPAMFSFLLQEGLQHNAAAKYPELKLTYKKDTNQLTLHGLPVEVVDIKNWILERRMNMRQKILNMDPSLQEFLRSVDCEEMSENQFISKGISAVYSIENEDVVLTGSTDRALTEAEETLKTELTFHTLPLEDSNVLEKPEWRSLNDQLCETYNSMKKTVMIKPSKQGLEVSGFKGPVSEVFKSLEKFIDMHSRIEEVLRVKSYAVVKFINEKKSPVWQKLVKPDEVTVHFDPKRPLIRLSGERVHVQPAVQLFEKIAETLHTDRLTIKKAGAKKYFREQGSMFLVMMREHRFVVILEDDPMLNEDTENDDNAKMEDLGQSFSEVQVPGQVSEFKVGAVVSGQGARGHGHQDVAPRVKESQIYRANETVKFEGVTKRQNLKPLSGTQTDVLDSPGFLETQSTQEGLRIILKKGNIQDAQSDVIVNTISRDVDLSKGAVSKALLQAAGPQMQAEASSVNGSSNLGYGNIVITGGYNLSCQKVFHTVCPFWNGGADSEAETLKQIFSNCLKKAEHQKMASISFPAIGTGNLGFPKDLVSGILLREIHDFSAKVRPQYLKEVTVVVHPSDNETVQSFIKSFRSQRPGPITKGAHAIQQQSPEQMSSVARSSHPPGLFGVVSTPTLGVHTVQVGHVTLEVSSGDITKEKSDAIVNSSNKSFSLKSGVSKAILDAAGLAVEQECAEIVGASQQKEMIVTSGGQLPCRHIIHVKGQKSSAAIKDAVHSVLNLCEAQKFSSVAFPALGTGQGGASPSAVADAMIDAVIDFVKKKKKGNLRSVKFLLFQTSMASDFHQSMLKRQQEGVEEDTTVFGWFKGKIGSMTNFFRGNSPEVPSNEDFVMASEEFEPAVFQLCAETQQDLNEARELINSFIVREHTSSPIRDSAINHFTREDAEMLTNLQRELTISIQLDKNGPEPVITVEGLTRDVVKAESIIRDRIRKVEKNEARKREAFMISSFIEWQYVDSADKLKPFDIYTNFDLEEAYLKKQPCIKIQIENEQYDVDLTQRMAIGRNGEIKLKRVDWRDQSTVPLPSYWEDMKEDFVKRILIQQGTQEYTDVENEFRRSGLKNTILNIERVQNSTLWRSYTIQKKHMDDKNKHSNNEKRLFHGTKFENIENINQRGFNRSYAGMNGAMYGNGAYFAVDPSYSAQGYSTPDKQGHKRMYLARVLVGDYTTGKHGLLSPPAKSSGSTDLYDSVTDNAQKPTMFVIFHDAQAYPEYLITFQ